MVNVLCAARDGDTCLVGEVYTLVDFRLIDNKGEAYPVLFEMLTKQDSITVDVSDFESFLKDVYKGNVYLSSSEVAYQKAFEMVFKKSKDTYYNCRLFYSGFNNDSFERRKTNQLVLSTGETIKYGYCKFAGVFLKIPKKDFWIYTLSSLGIQDPDLISTDIIEIPIGLTIFEETGEFIIKYKKE